MLRDLGDNFYSHLTEVIRSSNYGYHRRDQQLQHNQAMIVLNHIGVLCGLHDLQEDENEYLPIDMKNTGQLI